MKLYIPHIYVFSLFDEWQDTIICQQHGAFGILKHRWAFNIVTLIVKKIFVQMIYSATSLSPIS